MKKFKSLTVMLLALVLVFSSCLVAFADTRTATFTVTPSTTTAKAGDEITFTVNMSGAPACSSMGLEFTYDKDTFEYVSYAWQMKSTALENYDEEYDFASWAANKDLDGNGDIFTLVLKVKDTAKVGDATVTLKPTVKDDSDTAMDPGFDVNTVNTVINVPCNHQYGEWTNVDENNHSRTCSVCGNVETAAHTWNDGEVTKAATCTEEGVMTYTCTACGATKTEPIAKTAHTWNDGEVTTAATCTEDGVMTYTCTVCGETKTEVIPAAHTWDEGKVTKEATTEEEGEKTFTCTVCDETKVEKIAKLTPAGDNTDNGTTNGGSTTTTTTGTTTTSNGTATETGDATDIVLYSSIVVLSLGALAFVVYKKRKIND